MTPATSSLSGTARPLESAGDAFWLSKPDREGFGTRSRLRIRTCPLEGAICARAFWDETREVVDYHVVPHRPYHSYIQGDCFRIDTDALGQPVYLEVQCNRGSHGITDGLLPPVAPPAGGIRFLDLRIRFHELAVLSTRCHSATYIEFERIPVAKQLSFGSGVIFCVSADDCLSGLWLVNALPDPGGRLQSRWRSRAWQLVRRQRLEVADRCRGESVSPISSPKVC